MLEGGLVGHFEDDPRHPVFRQIVTSTRKSMGDNADAIYFDASISPQYTYRVRGRMAGAVYVSFTVEGGRARRRVPVRSLVGVLNDSDFDVDADGHFELFFGGEPRDRNWIALAPDAVRITTRHYWEQERSPSIPPCPDVALDIEVLDELPPPPRPDDATVAAGLRRRRRTTCAPGRSNRTSPARRAPVAFVSREPHVFPAPVTPGDHPLAAFDAAYSMAPYVLGPDEALVMTGRWPECRCANVSLWNRHLQTYDFVHRQVSLNRAQTTLEPDGSFRIVIAHADPGVPNWIDTEGRPFGMVFWRFFLPEGDIVTPHAEVVKFERVRHSRVMP